MAFWIGVHLPLLSLETFRPRWSERGAHVVVERDVVLTVSVQAAARGVRPGMRRGSVDALAAEAVVHERDSLREATALESISLALLQFTPLLAAAEESSLLLDVSGSVRLFGGYRAITRQVGASLATLGFTCQLGSAPSARGAWLLARYRPHPKLPRQRRVISLPTLIRRLDCLPYATLPQARPFADWLTGIGCRTLGDLRALPRGGLQRRTHPSLIKELDRAYGAAAALFDWVAPPKQFSVRLEMPDRIEHASMVLFGAKHLILQLTGWLVSQRLAVSSVCLWLEHERGRAAVLPTAVELRLAEPGWHEDHLTRLLKEQLDRLVLSASVIAIRLETLQLAAMQTPTESLFPEPGGKPGDFHRLLELLTARLGATQVLAPAPKADHRPEIQNTWQPAVTAASAASAIGARPTATSRAANTERPFWLLRKPVELRLRDNRPFYTSPLRLIAGPERIECGWWDGAAVMRDYFVAQGAEAACYWIYRERDSANPRWYLHGLFA